MDKLFAFLKRRATLIGLFLFVHFVQVCMTPIWIYAIIFDADRAWQMLVAYDRFANAALNGDSKHTISERAYRGMLAGSVPWCILCKILHVFHKNHCEIVGGSVDGVRAETIQESSNTESTNDDLRSKAGVFLIRLGEIGRSLFPWR